jgi:light-regulated signal transduction histidine kinase (bacteriophytochrome)
MDDNISRLTDCDREQIQFIGSIQPFGALLATDRHSIIVAAAFGPMFHETAELFIGKHLREFFGKNFDRIFESIDGRHEPSAPFLIRDSFDRWLTCIAYHQGELTIFEIERVPDRPVDLASVKFVLDRGENLESYLSFVAENLRIVTGFDRVMIYKFSSDWHGEVVAESLNELSPSFYGHRFPASDIPVPARNLFSKVWVRMIVNVDDTLIPILGPAGAKINLEKSILRASSPIHLEYLRNMGVVASMTLSLKCDGELWGLIACHHFSPRYLTGEERSFFSIVARILSTRITALLVSETAQAVSRISKFLKPINRDLVESNLHEFVRDNKNDLSKLIDCQGFSFVDGETIISEGHALEKEELRLLIQALDKAGLHVFHTDCIEELDVSLKNFNKVVAGIIAVKFDGRWLIWNRHELEQTILWAGNPNKLRYLGDESLALSPRKSFQAWKQDVQGRSLQWQRFEIEAAIQLAGLLAVNGDENVTVLNDQAKNLQNFKTATANQLSFLQSEFNNPTMEAMRLEELYELSTDADS